MSDLRRLGSEVAFYARRLSDQILLASGSGSRDDRLVAMQEVFYLWPGLCRRMSSLEEFAPNSACIGQEDDAELMTRLERFCAKQMGEN